MGRKTATNTRLATLGIWWAQDKWEADTRLRTEINRLWDADEGRRGDVQRNLQRWGLTMAGLHVSTDAWRTHNRDEAVRLNLVKNVVETLCAKVGSNRPRPFVLTDGGDFQLKSNAKKLQRFFDGAYQASDIYEKAPLVFRDAMLAGTGVFHFRADVPGGRTVCDKVFPLELLVDQVEAVDGDPDNMYRVSYRSKDWLGARYPSAEDAINAASLLFEKGDSLPSADSLAVDYRVCKVYEGWHRALMAEDGTVIPGRYVMAVDSLEGTIIDEPWEHEYFPFEVFHWTPPERGFWGSSAVSEVRPIEREVNLLLQMAQQAMKLCANPWILKPVDCKVDSKKLTNSPGTVIEYDGQVPPTVQVHQSMSPELYQQIGMLKAAAFEQVGTNEMQASATKPPGIESGRALEQLGEEHTVRFKHISQSFEHVMAVGCSRQFLRTAQRLDAALKAQGKPGYVLRAKSGKQMLKLKWDEVSMSPDDFFVDVFPTSILPHLPSGRTAEVERWQANQWITPSQAQELLEFPDLESVASPLTASTRLLEKQIDQMLEEGKEVFPDDRQNLEEAMQTGTYRLLEAQIEDCPESRLDLLRNFLGRVEELLAPPPAPGPDPMAGAAPTAEMPAPMPSAGMPGLPTEDPLATQAPGIAPSLQGPPAPMGPPLL